MSDTPRTDEAEFHTGAGFRVTATFCRQLERELTAAQIGAARYECVRAMNAHEFGELFRYCMLTGMPFDSEVDRRRNAK
jgi:hypothetical protein